MADGKIEGEDLKKLLLLAKKKRLSFAFCPGPKDDHIILIDKIKSPKVLDTIAKKEGSGAKVAFGTLVLNQRTLELTCEKPVPNMPKVLKKFLQKQRIMYDVLIIDINDQVPDSDQGQAPENAATESAGTTQAETAQARRKTADLVERIKVALAAISGGSGASSETLNKAKARAIAQIKAGDLQGADRTIAAIENAIASLRSKSHEPDLAAPAQFDAVTALQQKVKAIDGPAGKKLSDALAKVVALLDANNLKAADVLIARISQAIQKRNNPTKDSGTSAQSPEGAHWVGAQTRLQPAIDALARSGFGDIDTIKRYFEAAGKLAAAGKFDKAMAAASRTAQLIKAARSTVAPDNIAKTRRDWIKARASIHQQLDGLKSAVDQATQGVEGLEQVADKSPVLFEYLNGLDSSLESTLEQVSSASDGDNRAVLKTAAHKIIDQYHGVLDTDFFQAVDQNGFIKTNIRATALTSLKEVSAALDA
jgi:hypothetical protein